MRRATRSLTKLEEDIQIRRIERKNNEERDALYHLYSTQFHKKKAKEYAYIKSQTDELTMGRFRNGSLDVAGTLIFHENRRVAEFAVLAKRKTAPNGAKQVVLALMDEAKRYAPELRQIVLNADELVVGYWESFGFYKAAHKYEDESYDNTTPMVYECSPRKEESTIRKSKKRSSSRSLAKTRIKKPTLSRSSPRAPR